MKAGIKTPHELACASVPPAHLITRRQGKGEAQDTLARFAPLQLDGSSVHLRLSLTGEVHVSEIFLDLQESILVEDLRRAQL